MKRDLIFYGNQGLRKRCEEVKEITQEIRDLAQDLIDTVIAKDGAGLAAPQIGVYLRLFVSRYANGADEGGWPILCPPIIYINPKITLPSKERIIHGEGCLSIPGIYEEVERPFSIEVEALSLEGKIFKERATGWRARNIMHENDHLNGVLFIDRISPKKRKKIEPLLSKIKKSHN